MYVRLPNLSVASRSTMLLIASTDLSLDRDIVIELRYDRKASIVVP